MRTIDEDIKNQTFRTAYLLYGEEAYLKNQYKDKLKAALWQEGDTMNAAFYDGTCSPSELVNKAVSCGLQAIALTDHDTVEGIPDFLKAEQKISQNTWSIYRRQRRLCFRRQMWISAAGCTRH